MKRYSQKRGERVGERLGYPQKQKAPPVHTRHQGGAHSPASQLDSNCFPKTEKVDSYFKKIRTFPYLKNIFPGVRMNVPCEKKEYLVNHEKKNNVDKIECHS